MPGYLDLAGFKARTVMPAEAVDQLEVTATGWLDAQLEQWSRQIDSRLRKRYEVPFADPAPEAVKSWLARIVTVRAFLKRGVDPVDQQFEEIKADAVAAWDEIKEAANSDDGLFDLPKTADGSASGVSRGGPFGYSEASPYVWTDRQRATGVEEDRNAEGTHG